MNETDKNLLKAFTGESIARNKYTQYAKKAEKDGLIWVARIFEETADNERAHAEELYEKMQGKVQMTNDYDLHSLEDTVTNLRYAAEGEKFEWGKMYPDFKKVADEEGQKAVAHLFQEILEVEEKHEERYTILADKLEKGELYKSNDEVEWKCLNCGYIHKGNKAPEACPLCKKPQGWYMQIGLVR